MAPRTTRFIASGSPGTLHDQIIGGLAAPSWLREGSLLDNRWIIGTEDPQKRRNTDIALRFDSVLAPGLRLSDPRCEHDSITAKLLVYWSLSPSEGSHSSGASVAILHRNYLQFVRWRLSCGLKRNASLTPEWIEKFFETLRDCGVRGLLPLEERAVAFANAIRAGKRRPPTYKKGKHTYFDFDTAAEKLGVPNGRLLTDAARRILIALAAELGYPLRPDQARSSGFAIAWTPDSQDTEINDGSYHESSAENPMGRPTSRSAGRIGGFLRPLAYLWQFRGRLSHDPIGCNPFPGDRTVNSVARAIADDSDGRTFTVPPLQACTLIDRALCWVLDYAPDLQRYVEEVERVLTTEEVRAHWYPYQAAATRVNIAFVEHKSCTQPGSPWPIRPAYYPGQNAIKNFAEIRPSLRTVLFEYLAVACMIVIAAFSARRREEIESLRFPAIHHIDGDPWLETWIEKTIRDLDKIPVPKSVEKAVEVLSWLSSMYRQRTKERWLFQFDDVARADPSTKPKTARFDVYRSLSRFAEFVQLPPLPDGTQWDPKPHQFRRFFGITYYHRFCYPHLTALSNFYRHFDPDQTRRYVTEAARGGFLRQAEDKRVQARRSELEIARYHAQRLEDFDVEGESFRLARFRNVALGKDRISGWGGEVIKRQLDDLVQQAKAQLDIAPEDDLPGATLDSLLLTFVKDKRLEPNSLGHSYCKCTSEPQDLRSAACLTAREAERDEAAFFSAPDPAFAADHICSGCPHNVQFAECEPYWAETIAQAQQQLSCSFAPLLRVLTQERLDMAQAHYSRCFGTKTGG
ncbi:hypothetical protein ACD578_16420 [Microvirga sp. RSM25]|uniref:hypothetical protein n=1 Tax=Microvirga sp. RSM25 TaxID=3273802 RepID=UPI00384C7C7E